MTGGLTHDAFAYSSEHTGHVFISTWLHIWRGGGSWLLYAAI